MTKVFENRFVVFIDILGFGAMVSAAAKDPEGPAANKVDTALKIIDNLKRNGPVSVDQTSTIPTFRSHIFSDCIVMSVVPDPKAVSMLFIQLAQLTVDLMSKGVWIRGGMSLGQISKRHGTPWGPAIVEAYRIESQLAVNPRIALSGSALCFVKDSMQNKERDGLIVRDEDGIWALAPFSWALRSSYGAKPFLTKALGDEVKGHLEEAFEGTVDNPGVFKKIDWLSHQWDGQVKPNQSNYPEFDCRTKHGKERDLADIFNSKLDDAHLDGGTF